MRRSIIFVVLSLWVVLFPYRDGECGNIKITNPSVGTLSGGSTTVSFDVTWNRSWRHYAPGAPAPNNWDAAWVFVKYRTTTGGTIGDWKHASLNDTGDAKYSMGTGTAAEYKVGYPDTSLSFNISTNPGVGVFLYRSGDGSGTFTLTGASLSWNYSQDGVGVNDTVEVQVFGIEMIYIPEGAFFAGDNATSTASFKQGSSDNDPWYIGSENAITTANAAGTGTGLAETTAEYYYQSGGTIGEDTSGAAFTIPAAFPKGYQAFYMMKGEISQGQWVAFFNTLNTNQQSARDITGATGKNSDSLTSRNNVSWTSGDATLPDQGSGATYEAVAMNYISWGDLTAYLDWAGLRPMSELEFERAGRGPYRAVSGEYAWGSTSITRASSISNGGKSNEAPGAAANCVSSGASGPMRVGAMAYGDSTRIAAGAGYYGNMDLSGNLYERSVTVGNSTGRAFEGRRHGNGALTNSSPYGDADVSTWPGTNATGAGSRGGNWNYAYSYARLSDRYYAAQTGANRSAVYGGRGVRVAP